MFNNLQQLLWEPIDLIGTICIGKGWAYGLIPSPRMREYLRTTSKGRYENYTLKRGKKIPMENLTVSEDNDHLGPSVRGGQ